MFRIHGSRERSGHSNIFVHPPTLHGVFNPGTGPLRVRPSYLLVNETFSTIPQPKPILSRDTQATLRSGRTLVTLRQWEMFAHVPCRTLSIHVTSDAKRTAVERTGSGIIARRCGTTGSSPSPRTPIFPRHRPIHDDFVITATATIKIQVYSSILKFHAPGTIKRSSYESLSFLILSIATAFPAVALYKEEASGRSIGKNLQRTDYFRHISANPDTWNVELGTWNLLQERQ